MEDELLDLAAAVDIAYFLEATRAERPGPYDIALVEGSITTEHDAARIAEIREKSKILIALGTCATSGGVQALRNFADASHFASVVYPHPEYLSYLETSKPISDYVKTDLELWGCPVNKGQVLEVITALLAGRKPNLPLHTVCMDCKRREASCVMVDSGPYAGPVTRAGCGALPGHAARMLRLFGPAGQANWSVWVLRAETHSVRRCLLRCISGYAPAFRNAAGEILAHAKGVK
jgi:coenzyme F420-reducing hydrogenase gamma subunit